MKSNFLTLALGLAVTLGLIVVVTVHPSIADLAHVMTNISENVAADLITYILLNRLSF